MPEALLLDPNCLAGGSKSEGGKMKEDGIKVGK
jgi:hypothetical protein